jgi:hypothetical protein
MFCSTQQYKVPIARFFSLQLKAATQQHGRVFRQIEDTFRRSPTEERFVVLRFC